MSQAAPAPFEISVEVVPPAGPDAGKLLARLKALEKLPFQRFSVATNPLARPHMSALALSTLIQQHSGKMATLHCTTRDHNRLSLQGLLWGARALGIASVLVASGDYVALGEGSWTTTVRDVDVYDLVGMAREAGLRTGVVLDPRPETGRLAYEVRRLEQKVQAGAQFVVTQPVYDAEAAGTLAEATAGLGVPIMLGVLPLRNGRHARFLDRKVAGIAVPRAVEERLAKAADPAAEGLALAREMLALARERFGGACLMPAFGDYGQVTAILEGG